MESIYDNHNNKILGVGLGTVGPIIGERRLKENKDFFASGWKDKNLKQMLQDKINKKIIWINGVNAAILLEYLYGSGKKHNNIGYFNCGFGIRAGAIASKKIIHSMNNEEESFSKMIFSYNDITAKIGDYVTIKSINNNYIKQIGKSNLRYKNEIDLFKLICKKAEDEDRIALHVIENAAEIMAIGIINFIILLNSDLIILSGPLIMNCPVFYDKCISFVKQNITTKKIEFTKMGKYKDYAISLGAANVVIEKIINK